MKNKLWTVEEIEFLKEFYPIKGCSYCAEKLGRTKGSVATRCRLNNIYANLDTRIANQKISYNKFQENRSNDTFNVNVEQFLDIKKPDIAYFLGFLWADGHIIRNEIRLEIVKTDMDNIKNILDVIGKWNYQVRNRKDRQTITRASTNNKRLYNFLCENDYDKKSIVSADKILSKIPDNLKHYFFRGFVDGDGCISPKKLNINMSGSYNQSWDFIINLAKQLNIKYYNYRRNTERGNCSVIEFNGINSKVLGDYLYDNVEVDNIGLTRKINKYFELKNNYLNTRDYQLNIKKEKALKMYKDGIPTSTIIKEVGIAKTTLNRHLRPFR
jgi:hypothetical protein